MSWIKKLVRKNFKTNSASKAAAYESVPHNMCVTCDSCSNIAFQEDLKNNLYTCPVCGFYFKMPLKYRLRLIFGGDNYNIVPLKTALKFDPIKFKGKEKYSDKLMAYRKKTQMEDAAVVAYGKIGHVYAVCFVLDFSFLGGSMGVYVGEAFASAVKLAVAHKVPLLAVTASGGARMQEGIYSLMQMAKTTAALEQLKDANLPYVVLLTNPTTGGVTASFAMLGDVNLAEKGATIGFAGARVIEQTIRKKLPEGFQTAEYLLETGMVDAVLERTNLHAKLEQLLSLMANK